MVRVAVRTVLSVVMAGVCVACSAVQAYEGPERDDDQVAHVIPENQRTRQQDAGPFGAPKDGGRILMRINGQQLGFSKDKFAVLPGRVVVRASFQDKRTPWIDKDLETRDIEIAFDAVAGRTYAVRGRAAWSGYKAVVTIWVVDGSTGRSIASVAVPEANVILKTDVPELPGSDS